MPVRNEVIFSGLLLFFFYVSGLKPEKITKTYFMLKWITSMGFTCTDSPNNGKEINDDSEEESIFGFDDVAGLKPVDYIDEYIYWKRAEYMLFVWKINPLTTNIFDSFLFAEIGKQLWNEILLRYEDSSESMIYKIEKEFCSAIQGRETVIDYLTELSKLAQEYDVEYVDSKKRCVVFKKEQIGILRRQLFPFIEPGPHSDHVLADVFPVPQEICALENLSEVLSFEVWQCHLSDDEKAFFHNFYLKNMGPDVIVRDILFGELHPDNVVHGGHFIEAAKKSYYSDIEKYHNDMIENLQMESAVLNYL